MKRKIVSTVMLILLVNCASTGRVQFSNGLDEDEKVVRVVLSRGLGVLSVNSVKPNISTHLDNRSGMGETEINKVFNLLPGKHTLEMVFRNSRFEGLNTIPVTVEVKAGDIVFLCYDRDNEAKTWKPRVNFPPREKIEIEKIMGIVNIYMKEFADREKCFLQ